MPRICFNLGKNRFSDVDEAVLAEFAGKIYRKMTFAYNMPEDVLDIFYKGHLILKIDRWRIESTIFFLSEEEAVRANTMITLIDEF